MTQYLVRFDDICPTMNWEIWDKIEKILLNHSISPILAVVPKNEDPALVVSKANDQFWSRVRKWQEYGWSIGLHGYQHLLHKSKSGILRWDINTEFVGVEPEDQNRMINSGVSIMNENGIKPTIWVAPAHSFDHNTVSAITRSGIHIISDNFSLFPYNQNQIFWIPQSMWKFRRMITGTWTICFHHNKWTEKDVLKFEQDIITYKNKIVTVEYLFKKYSNRSKKWHDTLLHLIACHGIKLKRSIHRKIKNGR